MMNFSPIRFGTFIVLLAIAGGVGTTEAQAQVTRKSPIVEAVAKTQASIVTIVIPRTKYQLRDTVGTGVIIDERGYIVTNRHVIGSRQTVPVQMHDGTKLTAQVVLAESNYDLAILRINTKTKLKALPLAPVSDLMVGETVVAVGHPYGYTNTVSVGIISALGRKITMPTGEVLTGLIQTDASINPGNSGGPLLNINGELIGINAAIRDGAQGIAFAINAGTVRDLLAQRLSALKISGIGHGMELRERVLGETGDRQRVEVARIYKDTPAAQAGVRPGDMILAVADSNVKNSFDVERSLWGMQPGQNVKVKVRRQNEEMVVTMTLADGRKMNQSVKVDFSNHPEVQLAGNSSDDQAQTGTNHEAPATVTATREQ